MMLRGRFRSGHSSPHVFPGAAVLPFVFVRIRSTVGTPASWRERRLPGTSRFPRTRARLARIGPRRDLFRRISLDFRRKQIVACRSQPSAGSKGREIGGCLANMIARFSDDRTIVDDRIARRAPAFTPGVQSALGNRGALSAACGQAATLLTRACDQGDTQRGPFVWCSAPSLRDDERIGRNSISDPWRWRAAEGAPCFLGNFFPKMFTHTADPRRGCRSVADRVGTFGL